MQQDLFGICPYVTAQKLLTGEWTLLILHFLNWKTMRFGELQRNLPDLTQATLTKQLRMLEEHRLVARTVYSQIPPKVEYSLTELGRRFSPVLAELEAWGNLYIQDLRGNQPSGTPAAVEIE
jgi:DNA-binding HxlR family transcriptional regulator